MKNINYNDQRLFPFIGGLAIGGLTGAAFSNNHYPNYYYPQYPMYYQYPVYYYPSYPVNSQAPEVNVYNPVFNQTDDNGSVPLEFHYDNPTPYRSSKNDDYLKYKDVPEMKKYIRSDMI